MSKNKRISYVFFLIIVMIVSYSCYYEPNDKEFTFHGITIGTSESILLSTLGNPDRIDESKYGFKWYIYNNNYYNYIQVGVDEGIVRGVYSNAGNWVSKSGVEIGSSRYEVEKLYKPFFAGSKDYASEFIIDKNNVVIFFDKYNSENVTSILILDGSLDYETYPKESKELQKSLELQLFDLSNAIRVRNGKQPFSWNSQIAATARRHSADMANKDYFSHDNKNGNSPFDRMENDYINFSLAGENIAAGQPDPIYAHEELMNSKDHRVNILGDFDRLGIGVAFGGSYHIYYTQNFYTP
ncbi:CAP-associated domain-containing protein [Gottschalkia acidurici]|uniref:CAP domain-containing protein n=1 Tax=Clostridium acidurici TaxID=1556 RepID=UPI00031914A5|nr:CAP-associated domain-containing protein [Gottschalkia acidurici]